jgi:hypothetical protein
MIAATSGANVALWAAIAAQKRQQEEEEKMVQYNSDDLDGWEFKIVRSNMGRFRNYEKVQQVVAEEAKAGWELVEKFDDHRLRFKRRVEHRAKDQFLQQDPYRTHAGGGSNKFVLWLVLGVGLVVAGVALTIFLGVR